MELICNNNRYFIRSNSKILRTIDLANMCCYDEKKLKEILIKEYKAKLDLPMGGVSNILNIINSTLWFENQKDGLKAIEYLNTIKLYSII